MYPHHNLTIYHPTSIIKQLDAVHDYAVDPPRDRPSLNSQPLRTDNNPNVFSLRLKFIYLYIDGGRDARDHDHTFLVVSFKAILNSVHTIRKVSHPAIELFFVIIFNKPNQDDDRWVVYRASFDRAQRIVKHTTI